MYWYPSRMPAGSASAYYYVPANVKAHVDVDGVDTNGYDATTNPLPYALADYFNHAVRHPDELRLWQARVDAAREREAEIQSAVAAGIPPPPELAD